MRVLDVIKESALSIISSTNGVVSSQSKTPGQVQEIKTLLRKHTLVTGINPDGTFQRGGSAWLGPVDDNWTPALDNAIVRWKTSINYQVKKQPNKPLDTAGAPVINRVDLRYLMADVGTDGLLKVETPPQPEVTQPFSGRTYSQRLGTENVNDVVDIQSFLNGIGWSGWYRLIIEILERKHERLALGPLNDSQLKIRSAQLLPEIYSYQQQSPVAWYTNFRTRVLPNNVTNLEAVLGDGSSVEIEPPSDAVSRGDSFKRLYQHFARIIKGLWQKDDAAKQQARNDTTAPTNANAVTSNINFSSLAQKVNDALKNNLWGLITRGGTDENGLNNLLAQLKTAQDWDRLSQEYTRLFNEDLGERLVSELDDDEYYQLVYLRLDSINRINNLVLHTAINFGDKETIEVTVDNKKYNVSRNLGPDNSVEVTLSGRRNVPVKNVLLVDKILREAVTASGRNIPDFQQRPDNDALSNARDLFIETIQDTYPEMTPWYTKQEPFHPIDIPDIGRLRLFSIIKKSAYLVSGGASPESIQSYITKEILSDRLWLYGDDDTEGAAPIEFDARWQTESIGDFASLGIDSVPLTDDEKDLSERLISINEAEKQSAVREILESENPTELYIKIYNDLAKKSQWLEDDLGKLDSVEKFIEGNADNSLLTIMMQNIGIASAAPKGMSDLFKKAFSHPLGTDNELVGLLISNIQNKSDYLVINEKYRAIYNNELINDLEDEEWWDSIWGGNYIRLKNIIGEDVDLAKAGLSGRLQNKLDEFVDDTSEETLNELKVAIERENLDETKARALVTNLEKFIDNANEPNNPIIVELQNVVNNLKEEHQLVRRSRSRGSRGNAQ